MMKRLKTFIGEAVRNAKLYHRSAMWRTILTSNKLKTTLMGEGERAVVANPDLIKKHGGRYASFARSMSGDFMGAVYADVVVVLEFNSEKLRADYKLVPVDWFNRNALPNQRGGGRSEEEERLITDDEYIRLDKYLDGVHIFMKFALRDVKNIAYHRAMIAGLKDDLASNSTAPDEKPIIRDKIAQQEAWIRNMQDRIWDHDSTVAMYADKHPGVPVWVYGDEKSFAQGRWANAAQMNPHLWDKDDEDDYDEEA